MFADKSTQFSSKGDPSTLAPIVQAPLVPATGANFAAQLFAGRAMMGEQPSLGSAYQFQPLIGRRKVSMAIPVPSTVAPTVIGMSRSTQGTPTLRIASTASFFAGLQRVGYVSNAGAASATGWFDSVANAYCRGNAAGRGGFFAIFLFGISDAALVGTANMFVGLRPSAAIADALPSTFVNCIGVGCDNGDTRLQLYASGAAAQARAVITWATGPNAGAQVIMAANANPYEFVIFAAPNGAVINWQLTDRSTGDSVSGTVTLAASLPSNTTLLAPVYMRSNGAAGVAAVALDDMGFYSDQDG